MGGVPSRLAHNDELPNLQDRPGPNLQDRPGHRGLEMKDLRDLKDLTIPAQAPPPPARTSHCPALRHRPRLPAAPPSASPPAGVECRVEGVECRVEGVECRVEGVECRVEGVECRVEGVESHLLQRLLLRSQQHLDPCRENSLITRPA